MAYNLMRVFEEGSKTQNPERLHPSDKKYTNALEKREGAAKERGDFVNPLHFQSRITRISSTTIRIVQSAIMAGRSLVWVVARLVANLVLRV